MHCQYRTVNQLFASPSSLQSQHALPVPYCQPVVCRSIQPSVTTRTASTVLSTSCLPVHPAFSHNTHCQYRTVNQLFAGPSSLQSQHTLPVPYCQPVVCRSIQPSVTTRTANTVPSTSCLPVHPAFSHYAHCQYRTVDQLFASPSSLQSLHALPVPYRRPVVCQSIQPSVTTRTASTVPSTSCLPVHPAFSHYTHCQYRTVD